MKYFPLHIWHILSPECLRKLLSVFFVIKEKSSQKSLIFTFLLFVIQIDCDYFGKITGSRIQNYEPYVFMLQFSLLFFLQKWLELYLIPRFHQHLWKVHLKIGISQWFVILEFYLGYYLYVYE